jgi:hypothetical protein
VKEASLLECVDRILVAIKDAGKAAEDWATLLGAEQRSASRSRSLGARRLLLALGASEVELLEPDSAGPVREFVDRWGEGLYAAGFASRDLTALLGHLKSRGVRVRKDGAQAHISPEDTHGLRIVLSPFRECRGPGPVKRLYEVTNMVTDWQAAAARYTDLFALDPSRFCPITSEAFGYTGSLLLFDPPARLDRIELAQVVNPDSAMGRFVAKRGESLYMCFVEADDLRPIIGRLDARGARWAQAPGEMKAEHLFIHPSALHGVLTGVSRTNHAWVWSGRPELAGIG